MTALHPPSTTPFDSLADLRAEHLRLLKQSKESAAQSDPGAAELATAVVEFLARTQATGKRLDTPSDREAAQSILDYWTATLFTLPGGVSARSTLPALIPGTSEDAVNLRLADFDTDKVLSVATAASQWLAALPPEDQALVRRILMRLVVLPG